jgi:hypothetical protein
MSAIAADAAYLAGLHHPLLFPLLQVALLLPLLPVLLLLLLRRPAVASA